MARIRSIKPEFWTDEKVCSLARPVRLTFLGIISAMADDEGRLKGDPRLVKAAVYPLDDDVDAATVRSHLEDLASARLIQRYRVNGEDYIQVVNWKKHQRIDKPTASRLPAPPPDAGPTPPRPFVEASAKPRRGLDTERSGADGSGEEEIRSGTDGRARASSPTDRFLETFYQSATPERRAEVEAQLAAALTPEGARIRKGEFVSAKSKAHLEKCMLAVIAEPPRKPDAAIVIVLRKLCDPILNDRGQTVTEAASDKTKRDDKLFTIYLEEKSRAGRAWAKEHSEEWADVEAKVDRSLGMPSDMPMYETIRKTQLAEAAGNEAGFPTYEEWLSAREVAVA